jgi:hypothetical protein
VESERVGDASGAPVPDFGPGSLLLEEAGVSRATFTCKRAQTSWTLKTCVGDIRKKKGLFRREITENVTRGAEET